MLKKINNLTDLQEILSLLKQLLAFLLQLNNFLLLLLIDLALIFIQCLFLSDLFDLHINSVDYVVGFVFQFFQKFLFDLFQFFHFDFCCVKLCDCFGVLELWLVFCVDCVFEAFGLQGILFLKQVHFLILLIIISLQISQHILQFLLVPNLFMPSCGRCIY